MSQILHHLKELAIRFALVCIAIFLSAGILEYTNLPMWVALLPFGALAIYAIYDTARLVKREWGIEQ